MDRIPTDRSACQPIVDQLLPANSIHLLGGAPGAGKTALAAWLLRELRDGRPILGYPSHPPATIAVIAADRGWQSHRQWFEAVGLGDIPFYSAHDDRTFNWDRLERPDGWKWALFHAIDQLGSLPRGSLLLIDPLTPFFGDHRFYNGVFAAMGKFSQFLLTQYLTVLGTAHAGKQRGGRQFQYMRPQDRILGTTAIVGCCDTVLYLATPEETRRRRCWELTWAPHHAPAGSCRLLRNDDGLFELVAVDEHRAAVLESISADRTSISAILEHAKAHGVPRRTVYDILHDLADEHVIEHLCSGWWRRARAH